jgi:hypothetical protein
MLKVEVFVPIRGTAILGRAVAGAVTVWPGPTEGRFS